MKNMKHIFVLGALALTLTACGKSADKKEEAKDDKAAETTETAEKTGSASAAGYGGDIKLTVTMEGDKIKDINIDEEAETEGIGKDALPKLVDAAKEANSSEVEAVSGATVTSTAFKDALKSAMEAAK